MEAKKRAVIKDVKEEEGKCPANIENSAVNAYFRSIKGRALLTADEEKKLFKKAKKGDMRAREAIINANLRLPIYLAKKYLYKTSHLKMGDLIHAGNEGLIRAVRTFDPAKECRFSTYATFWIRSALEREVGDYEHAIRKPMYVVDGLKRYKKEAHLLAHKLERCPSSEEVAAEMGESVA
ncbi:MAG: sigma-70 family RNA polymerase sigma factor [Patescibacteria group bacterium]